MVSSRSHPALGGSVGLQSPEQDLRHVRARHYRSLQIQEQLKTPTMRQASQSHSFANSALPSGTRVDGGSQSPVSFARPCKQAQPQAQTARSLSTFRVSERPVQALTPGPFRFLGFLHEPCVRCCGFTRHSCCGNSDADCCGSGGGFKKHRIPRKSHRSSTLSRIFGRQRSRSSKPMVFPRFSIMFG